MKYLFKQNKKKFIFYLIAPLVCSLRLLLAVLAFFGFFLCYAQRNGLAYESIIKIKSKFDFSMLVSVSFVWLIQMLTMQASQILIIWLVLNLKFPNHVTNIQKKRLDL
jgi:ABC-type Fe3+-siderophore transport system permease subunit